MTWTDSDTAKLIRMAQSGRYTYAEIAADMGKQAGAVRHHARTLGLPSRPAPQKIGKWNCKHAHLREPVMKYFLKHTWDETRQKFGLTQSELKSLFTVAYRDPKFAHLRKDTRKKDRWTGEELRVIAQNAGILSRLQIAQILGRGNARVIKERLRKFNSGTKYLNGMPLNWAVQLWGPFVQEYSIKTLAGPGGATGNTFCFRIIPWTACEKLSVGLKTDENVKRMIRIMATFQRWIHGTKSNAWVKRKIVGAINEQRSR